MAQDPANDPTYNYSSNSEWSDNTAADHNNSTHSIPNCQHGVYCDLVKTGNCCHWHPACRRGQNCSFLKNRQCHYYHPSWHFTQQDIQIPWSNYYGTYSHQTQSIESSSSESSSSISSAATNYNPNISNNNNNNNNNMNHNPPPHSPTPIPIPIPPHTQQNNINIKNIHSGQEEKYELKEMDINNNRKYIELKNKMNKLEKELEIMKGNGNLNCKKLPELIDLERILFNSLKRVREVMNDRQKSYQLCIICFTNSKNVLLRPCNHLSICQQCSIRAGNQCPLCKANITDRIIVYN